MPKEKSAASVTWAKGMDAKAFLTALAAQADRDRPLSFVGRRPVLDLAKHCIGNIPVSGPANRAGTLRNPPGQTLLIQGPPGAGKSALLYEIEAWVNSQPDSVSAQVDRDLLAKRESLLSLVSAELRDAPEDTPGDSVSKAQGGNAGFPLLKGQWSRTSTKNEPVPTSVAALERRHGKALHQRKLVLLIDEIQDVSPEGARTLNMLHTQTTLPVMAVCAGTGDSQGALGQSGGVSRWGANAVVNLAGLAPSEALQCAHQTLHKVVGTPTTPRIQGHHAIETWAEQLAEASRGWPQHLHNYLASLWKALSAQEQPDLSRAPLEETLAQGDVARRSYYEQRMERFLGYEGVVAAVHQGLAKAHGGILPKGEVIDIIGEFKQRLPEHTQTAFDRRFEDVIDFAEALLKSGMVANAPNGGGWASPIPSLTDYVLEQGSAGLDPDFQAEPSS